MPGDYSELLNPDKALIFRITRRENVPWIYRVLFQLAAQDGNRQSHLCQAAARF